MADSVDRVFVHALNTVKKIPKTGSARPPTPDRLRLYGLYKQAMEGDVDGVMERPTGSSASGLRPEDVQRERDKWDAWNSQRGLGRTEAKRRYIEALIETMHKYATSADGQELVAELEFVWNQIKNNTPSSSDASPKAARHATFPNTPTSIRLQQPLSGTDGPMKVLNPMSEQDEAEMRSVAQLNAHEEEEEGNDEAADRPVVPRRSSAWSKTVERALVALSAEVAALREQITTRREWRSKRQRTIQAWAGWIIWIVTKHVLVDLVALAVVLLWMRWRKDRRFEDHVRAIFRLAREYMRKILPSR